MPRSRETELPGLTKPGRAISQPKPLIIGHRGASALAPENTMAAFRRAFDGGAHGIELDVRLARDGVPVVIHDATLQRTGLTSGEVAGMTSTELMNVDAGRWFNRAQPGLAHADYAKQRVLTLSQVFRFLIDRPGVVYVELKTGDPPAARQLVQSVVDLTGKFGFEERVVVVSFDLAALAEIKSLASSIRTGALFSPRRREGLAWGADTILNLADGCGADQVLPQKTLARPKLIDKANARHLPVVVWTVDDLSWVGRAKRLGIHALITNNPSKLLAAT